MFSKNFKSISFTKETDGGDPYGIEITGENLKINFVSQNLHNSNYSMVLANGTELKLTDICDNIIVIKKGDQYI